jgi:hypothetical protein
VGQYYYFAATLPMPRFSEPLRLGYAEFMAAAKRLISAPDYTILAGARLDNFDTRRAVHPLFDRFREWELNLRNRLAAFRASGFKVDGAPFQRRVRTVIGALRPARVAIEAADPLKAEEALLKARWEYLSDAGNLCQFDISFLVVYALKLQLLERKARLTRDIGAGRHAALEADLDRELAERMTP